MWQNRRGETDPGQENSDSRQSLRLGRRAILRTISFGTLAMSGGTGIALADRFPSTVGVGNAPPANDGPTDGFTVEQIAKFANPGGDYFDLFGISVAIERHTIAVGARNTNALNGDNSGAVYVFTRTDADWSLQQTLVANDGDRGDALGTYVDIDGNTIVAGARNDDLNGTDSGSAYIFTRSNGEWVQQQKIVPEDSDSGDSFGRSVAINDNTILVGAPQFDESRGNNTGAVYVFSRSGTKWTQQQKLVPADGDEDDGFGISVAVDGNTAVIGARWDEHPTGYRAGSAYVFSRSGGHWRQEQKLAASDGNRHDWFGRAIALSGNTALIGAPMDGDTENGGSAYVFSRSGGHWRQEQKLTGNRSDGRFGYSVALHNKMALVGDIGTGSAVIFRRSGSQWSNQQRLTPADGDTGDQFGVSVALQGSTAIIGAFRADDSSAGGAAYGFQIFEDSISRYSRVV